jgi:hypothetical protein
MKRASSEICSARQHTSYYQPPPLGHPNRKIKDGPGLPNLFSSQPAPREVEVAFPAF